MQPWNHKQAISEKESAIVDFLTACEVTLALETGEVHSRLAQNRAESPQNKGNLHVSPHFGWNRDGKLSNLRENYLETDEIHSHLLLIHRDGGEARTCPSFKLKAPFLIIKLRIHRNGNVDSIVRPYLGPL